jgi:circadian clock protein KaiC
MKDSKNSSLRLLATGVPGLDEVLGGGLPEYSFNLLAGPPGAGKTTLMHQLLFANATAERPALYFTVVGEPPLKMLRYQQQMDFFDPQKIGSAIRFVDLSPELLGGDLGKVVDKLVEHVKESSPALVVVDSFRTVLRTQAAAGAELELQGFLQRLALHLTGWQVTSFLVGEYGEDEIHDNPVFTVADGILWLSQQRERNSVVRKLEVMKMRGRATVPGLHTLRMSAGGIHIFPRASAFDAGQQRQIGGGRTRTGVSGLDDLLGGGLPVGDTTLIAGPSGTGKSLLSTQFIAEGLNRGEAGVLAVFEEHPQDYLARAKDMGFDLQPMVEQNRLSVLALRPLDLSADEILFQVQQAVERLGARRLVIDSLNGLELALAPNFRQDFRESLYRLMGRLTGGGVGVMMTVEVAEAFDQIQFSPHEVSFLAQNILFLRYVEIEARLRRMITVIKMRRSAHSSDMCEYEITDRGMRILEPLRASAALPLPPVRGCDGDGLPGEEALIRAIAR